MNDRNVAYLLNNVVSSLLEDFRRTTIRGEQTKNIGQLFSALVFQMNRVDKILKDASVNKP